ncbi:MAG: hypothetical protein HY816_19950 [Candidatus Wallbacteria bacterium]|nr:hypothetical protein [Candidatus Wallbacteria bacterium]
MPSENKDLRSFAFDFDGVRFVFPANPQQEALPYRTRATYVPTKGGGFEENFGMHIGGSPLTISGSFPIGETPDGSGTSRTGVSHYKLLEQAILEFYDKFTQAQDSGGSMPQAARYYDLGSGHAFEVEINEFRLQRSVDRPLTYAYAIQMTILSILTDGEQLPDFLKTLPTSAAQPIARALSQMQSARAVFGPQVAALSARTEVSPQQVRALAKRSADVGATHDQVFLAGLQFVAGATSTIPIERAAVVQSALDTRGLAAVYGAWYPGGLVSFASIVALHQIQRSLQRLAATPAVFPAQGGIA